MTLELPQDQLFEYADIVHFIRQYADEGIKIDKLLIYPSQAEYMNEWPWLSMAYVDEPPREIVFLATIFGKHELNIVYTKPQEDKTPDEKQHRDTDRVRQSEKTGAGQAPARPKDRQGVPRSHKKGKAGRASQRPARPRSAH